MLKELLKVLLPATFRLSLRKMQKFIIYSYRHMIIKLPVFFNMPLKIIVGAALTSQSGWWATNEQWFDITKKNDWLKLFKGKKLLTHVVAEHVFEHLSVDECQTALQLIYSHMLSGGRIRIAVPDGFNPESIYIKHVGINGIGADASDHKQLLTMESLRVILTEAGFVVQPLEGYTKEGILIQNFFDVEDGYIFRSRNNPNNMALKNGWDFIDANTSLIIDGIK